MFLGILIFWIGLSIVLTIGSVLLARVLLGWLLPRLSPHPRATDH